jgi:prepilin-type N-terminal cleavage/methylation domain-containing protein/prepilin-type processing-associated H-X9-DG protein
MKTRTPKAFTLIEMLVVIGVIAALAMFLLPAFNRAREQARNVRCVANLKNLHTAAMNRAADDARLPAAGSYWYQGSDGGWYHCRGWAAWNNWPQFPNDGPFSTKPGDGTYSYRGASGTACITNGSLYGYVKSKDVYLCPTHLMNTRYKDAVRSYAMNASISQANVLGVKSSTIILFGDDRNIETSQDTLFYTNEIAQWHTGGGNVVFVDGHVERR